LLRPTAAERPADFLQISDSHVGFDKPANPNALARSRSVNKIKALSGKTSLHHSHRRHHPSLEAIEFDDADRIISQAGRRALRAGRARCPR